MDPASEHPERPEPDVVVVDGSLEPVVARLAAAEARLAARNAALAAWADRASHDMMTPLAVIRMVADTLDGAGDRLSPADRQRLLASITNQASRAMAMLDEAIALAREDSPGPPSFDPPPRP